MFAYKGVNQPNEATVFIMEYLDRKMLAKLGCKLDLDELSDFDANVYRLISNEFSKLEDRDMKSQRKR